MGRRIRRHVLALVLVEAPAALAAEPALADMKGRWKHPIKGMGWYKDTKKAFAALPED